MQVKSVMRRKLDRKKPSALPTTIRLYALKENTVIVRRPVADAAPSIGVHRKNDTERYPMV